MNQISCSQPARTLAICSLVGFLFLAHHASAALPKDSLVLKNGDKIVGEIKSLDKGVITVETDYSKNDFTIEWLGIKEIYTVSNFLITLKDGRRINGNIQSMKEVNHVIITSMEKDTVQVHLEDLVFLKELKSDFWGRLRANIDIGITYTKANNMRQYSLRAAAEYLADKWQADVNYNRVDTRQDSTLGTHRIDAAANYKYFISGDWYVMTSLTFLSNTEQSIHLRTNGKAGVGKMFWHTNRKYWGVGGGLAFNNESYTNNTPARNSLEAYVGSELNLFDIGDFSVLNKVFVYPSLTESGRVRCDFNLDAKYDLPKDFYLKPGITFNYDNRPAAVGKQLDYVFVFTIGWEL
jgi:hypothetical protein